MGSAYHRIYATLLLLISFPSQLYSNKSNSVSDHDPGRRHLDLDVGATVVLPASTTSTSPFTPLRQELEVPGAPIVIEYDSAVTDSDRLVVGGALS